MILELGIILLEIEPADDFLFPEFREQIFRGHGCLDDELIEERAGGGDGDTRYAAELLGSAMGLGEVLLGDSLKPSLSEQTEINRGRLPPDRFVCATDGGGQFSPVL